MIYDVIVIGASACGLLCARDCAERGLRTLVLEEDSEVGKQGKCTALVSKNGLDSLGVAYEKSVLNEIRGARIIAGKTILAVKRRKPVALVLDRQRFDEQIAREARRAGAEIRLGKKVTGFKEEKNFARIFCGKNFFDSRFVVGADGAASFTANALGFPTIDKFVLCWEAEYDNEGVSERDSVNVFLDNDFFKGFLGWLVPAGSESVRVGLGTTNFRALGKGKKVLFSLADLSEAKKLREFTAVIPLETRAVTQKKNVLLVGDAAGQTKATTGGGIVFGGGCARIAARCVAERSDYETEWRKKFGRTLEIHRSVRNLLDACDNQTLSALIRGGSFFGLPFFLRVFGDMDFVLRK